MAFNFGVSTSSKGKRIIENILYVVDKYDPSEKDYYIFLVEGTLSKQDEIRLISDITSAGYKSYFILGATILDYHNTPVKGGKTQWICDHTSRWKKYINHDGKHVAAIMTFGDSMILVNKGVDVEIEPFMGVFNKSYYYLGHGFIGDYDTFIFPVHGTNKLYEKDPKNPANILINWTTRFFYDQLKRMKKEKVYPDMSDYEIVCIKTKEEANELFEKYKGSKFCSFDLETSGLDFLLDNIKCLTLSFDPTLAFYIDWSLVDVDKLSDLLESCEITLGVNPKFDIKFLWKNGLRRDIYPTDDVMLMSHVFHTERLKGLKSMAFYYTYFGGYDDKLDVFKKRTGIEDYSKIPDDILSEYAALDVIVALRAYIALKNQIEETDKKFPNEKVSYTKNDPWTMWRWYKELVMGIFPGAVDAEYEGVYIDYNILLKHREELKNLQKEYIKDLAKVFEVSDKFEFSSTKKLGELLEKKGWPCVGRSASGEYSTDDDAIQEWKRQGINGIDEIIKFRKVNVLLSTFIGYGVYQDEFYLDFCKTDDYNKKFKIFKNWFMKYRDVPGALNGWEKYLRYHPEDDSWRLHCNYSICGTSTFRFIGREPNLQQIPTRGKYAHYVKKCFSVPRRKYFEVTDENGKVYKFLEGEIVSTERGRISIEDLKEDDKILPTRRIAS